MDIFSEIEEIGRMLNSASILMSVRQEVSTIMKKGFVVTDGSHQDGCEGYEVVVRCGSHGDAVTRRLREKMPDVDIQRIADDVVGLRRSRRELGGK